MDNNKLLTSTGAISITVLIVAAIGSITVLDVYA
jgi:hypothetical protein